MSVARVKKQRHLTKREEALKARIIDALIDNGFRVNPHLRLPEETKDTYKEVQQNAKEAQIGEHGRFLRRVLPRAMKACRNGRDIVPEDIDLEIRTVKTTLESNLFFWWNLVWWSMPYQRAYGRQMRFIIWDRAHDAPFALLQLQSPLLRMRARDEYLDIPQKDMDYWVNMSMNAQRIGALPPYNQLIGGKMAALAVTSNEVRKEYAKKYAGVETRMEKRTLEPHLLFVTTTSAFGKSSMYDRLAYKGRLRAIRIGQTRGTGTFHISDSLSREIYAMLERMGVDTSTSYGHGPSRKVKLIKKALNHLGLAGFYNHGIRRDVYLFPLAKNLPNVIHKGKLPVWDTTPFDDLAAYWKERWAVPRSVRMPTWREFDADTFFEGVRNMIETGTGNRSG